MEGIDLVVFGIGMLVAGISIGGLIQTRIMQKSFRSLEQESKQRQLEYELMSISLAEHRRGYEEMRNQWDNLVMLNPN